LLLVLRTNSNPTKNVAVRMASASGIPSSEIWDDRVVSERQNFTGIEAKFGNGFIGTNSAKLRLN